MAETRTRAIVGRTVSCTADPVLRAQVDALLDVIVAAPAHRVDDGFVLLAGWSTFKLIDVHGELVVHCPDFTGDLREWVSNVTFALAVEVGQSTVCRLVGVQRPEPAVFSQKLLCAEGVSEAHAIVAHRTAPVDTRDSGWLLGFPGEEPDVESLTVHSIGQLVRSRTAVLNPR